MSGQSIIQIRNSYTEYLISINKSLETSPANLEQEIPDLITIATTLTFTVGLIQV